MSLDLLINRVRQAEQAVDIREHRTRAQWRQLKATWHAGWTPGRIVIAGLAAGFVAGRGKPLRLAGNGGALDLLRALMPLFVGVQAAQAAAEELQPGSTEPPESPQTPPPGTPPSP